MNTAQENVDSGEIAKFDALASRWWDPQGEFRPLHEINPLRLDYIRQRATLVGRRALDVGCGGGILAESLAAAGAEVTAIDMAEKPLAVARLHQAESGTNVNYLQSTAEEMAGKHAGQFDVVTCLEMLEHVPSPGTVIAAWSITTKNHRPRPGRGAPKYKAPHYTDFGRRCKPRSARLTASQPRLLLAPQTRYATS